MSGTGKSSVISELAGLGHRAIDLDDPVWSRWVDHEGDPTGAMAGKDWVWREEAVSALLAEDDGEPLFASGCASNMGPFLAHFDHVVLLSAPAALLLERLASRRGNPYGKLPGEAAAVLENLRTVEPLLRRVADHEIDTRAPLAEVVEAVLRLVGVSSSG